MEAVPTVMAGSHAVGAGARAGLETESSGGTKRPRASVTWPGARPTTPPAKEASMSTAKRTPNGPVQQVSHRKGRPVTYEAVAEARYQLGSVCLGLARLRRDLGLASLAVEGAIPGAGNHQANYLPRLLASVRDVIHTGELTTESQLESVEHILTKLLKGLLPIEEGRVH